MSTLISATNLPTLRRDVAHTLIRLAANLCDDGASLDSTVRAAQDLLALACEEEKHAADASTGAAAVLLHDRSATLNQALVGVIQAEFTIRRETAAYTPNPFA